MGDRYWEGHRDGCADMRERCEQWRTEDKAEIENLRTALDTLPTMRHWVVVLEHRDRLKAALRQAYIDNGCREDEAEEMVAAIKQPDSPPVTDKDSK